MEPTFVTREAFVVIGVSVRGNPMALDYRSIWANQFMPHQDELMRLSTDKAYYGVFFETDETEVVDHMAAVAVDAAAQAPAGLVRREVPAATYAVFDCTVKTIGQTWNAIMSEWLPASDYTYDLACASFELYPPGTEGEDGPLAIYVPVKAK